MGKENRPWIDVSISLEDGMVHWPGDPPVQIGRVKDMERGDAINLSAVSMGAHSGTHMDAPLHFIDKGNTIDRVPLEVVIGRVKVIEIKDLESIKPEEFTDSRINSGDRVLFKTVNSPQVWQQREFAEDFVFLSDSAADFLVEHSVLLVGIDYLSVGGYRHGGSYVHNKLLSNGIWIIEGLDLSNVSSGEYEMVCLPLKIKGAEGAPARVALRESV
ncbi:cyclase family protein [Chloroflexota bacterium]